MFRLALNTLIDISLEKSLWKTKEGNLKNFNGREKRLRKKTLLPLIHKPQRTLKRNCLKSIFNVIPDTIVLPPKHGIMF